MERGIAAKRKREKEGEQSEYPRPDWKKRKRNAALLKTLLPSSNCEILAWVSWEVCQDMILNAIKIRTAGWETVTFAVQPATENREDREGIFIHSFKVLICPFQLLFSHLSFIACGDCDFSVEALLWRLHWDPLWAHRQESTKIIKLPLFRNRTALRSCYWNKCQSLGIRDATIHRLWIDYYVNRQPFWYFISWFE